MNTGKPSEDRFESHWTKQGKKVFLHRVSDKSDLVGMNRKRHPEVFGLMTRKLPSDYVLTVGGITGYAELKSTSDPKGFKKKNVKPHQLGFAQRQIVAGGKYWFFVHHIPTDRWYWIEADKILAAFDQSGTMLWEDLEPYLWSIQ